MSIDTTDDHLIREHLQGLAGVQTPNDIERIQDTGLPAATLMNETNTEIIAAVVLTHGLRALSAVGPGCSTDSLCMTTATGTPYGSTGSGTLSGTWKNIASAAAYGRDARFTWTGGAVNVAWGVTNDFGAPVTMTEVSR